MNQMERPWYEVGALPPVGIHCLVLQDWSKDLVECEILAHYRSYLHRGQPVAVYAYGKGEVDMRPSGYFKPKVSNAEIFEQYAEKVVQDMDMDQLISEVKYNIIHNLSKGDPEDALDEIRDSIYAEEIVGLCATNS